MTKHGKDYRGEDRTLEMIRERANETWPDEISKTSTPEACDMWNSHWSYHCEQLAKEMCSEGLINTAREILSWHSNSENFEITNDGLWLTIDDQPLTENMTFTEINH